MNQSHYKQKCFWLIALFFTTAGIFISLYSAQSHYKNYTDPLYSSFCALSRSINCDTVAQSPWSIIMGVPVAWWGFLFYLTFFFLLLIENYRSLQTWRILFYISLLASAISLGLAGIALWKIKSLCLVCLATYALTFALTYTCWIGKRRIKETLHTSNEPETDSGITKNIRRNYGLACFIFFTGILCLYFFLPRYWDIASSTTDISTIPHGLTEEGHPWIGAVEPQLTITQFSDYQCFQCNKMHFYLRQLLLRHPDTLRLVHRNYPMDHAVNPKVVPEPFHEGSGHLAKIAILAAAR
ncbi:MAG: hypothetical protein D3923_14770, partial [Candidatus Electrothrix sp. AR3]|nr:hypothetical protein [Candidatus Electrothrix sp. AR3]